MPAVETVDLVRDYESSAAKPLARRSVRALDGVSLSVDRGTTLGILGPNGAGKTTMVKILTTIITPTAGQAYVLGYDVVSQAQSIRPHIGVAYGGDLGLYWRLDGLDNLVFAGQLQGLSMKRAESRAWEMLDLFGLRDAAKKRVNGYSRGMRQRLHLARCLLHDPELVFLDEPTSGLDPAAAKEMRGLVRNLHAAGKTVFLATHDMGEAEELCDVIAVMARGKLLAFGSVQEIKHRLGPARTVEIRVSGPDIAAAAVRLGGSRSVNGPPQVNVLETGEAIILLTYCEMPPLQHLLYSLEGLVLHDIKVRETTLEEAYLRLVREGADGC